MGASCCVASRDKENSIATQVDVSAYRNVCHSPSWSFRWDNRTHIEDIMENPVQPSSSNNHSSRPETKVSGCAATEGHSNLGGSTVIQASKFHKIGRKKGLPNDQKAGAADLSRSTDSSPEERESSKVLGIEAVSSHAKISRSIPSTPLSTDRAIDSSCSRSHSQPFNLDMWRKARRSPGYQLCRQVSDSKIPSLKSLNESCSPEERLSSSMLSPTGGSQGGSSDGWSMQTFSELVASSQRERWSVDSQHFGSVSSKGMRSSALQRDTASPEEEVCKLCSKIVKERSFWNGCEVPVVAVMVCGHVYHADCLDRMTDGSQKYDPPCPVCTHGEKCTTKMFGKVDAKLRSKLYNSAVADFASDEMTNPKKKIRKGLKLGSSSSTSRVAPPSHPSFLKRHFSIGSWSQWSEPDAESSSKKGFWRK